MPKHMSKSPVRKTSKSPVRKTRKSPVRKTRKSKSPVRKTRKSKSPVRKTRKSKSPFSFGVSIRQHKRYRDLEFKRRQKMLISHFKMDDVNILNFRRLVNNPGDCVINAMQLIGMIDSKAAEVLRIMVGNRGFQVKEVESIFMLYGSHIFKFQTIPNFETWKDMIIKTLFRGNVMFTGYDGHVFIIGALLDGNYVLIDPQLPEGSRFCYFAHNNMCENFIKNKSFYYILTHSEVEVSESERLRLINH